MYHITYKLPGYPSLQVERFSELTAAEVRYDELAGNTDVFELSQPFVPDIAAPAAVVVTVHTEIEIPLEAPSEPSES